MPFDACAGLAASALFRGTKSEDFEPLRSHTRERSYSRGEYLWHAGDNALWVYLILSGEITTARVGPDGEEYVVEVYLAHDVVGQLPMLDDKPVRLLHAMAAAATEYWGC